MTAASSSTAFPTLPLTVGALVTVTVAFFVGANQGSLPAALMGSAFAGILGGALVWRQRPAHELQPDRNLTFRTTAELRRARERLVAARQQHVDTLKERQGVRRRLDTLRQKMMAVGLSAYSTRIATVERGLATLDRQVGVITRLRDGYDRSIAMIDIELEAGAAADMLDATAGLAIADAMFELRELEGVQAELARQLEANIEVENLIASR